jgi:hypothetical protein
MHAMPSSRVLTHSLSSFLPLFLPLFLSLVFALSLCCFSCFVSFVFVTVISFGPGAKDITGKLSPVNLTAGDKVLLPEHGGMKLKVRQTGATRTKKKMMMMEKKKER